jgi:Zn-dependent M28 family amino/carboxypeptidase
MRFALLVPLLLIALPVEANDEIIAAKLRDAALTSPIAYDVVESLTTEIGPRVAGSPAEARARDWAVAKMKAMGFQNVRVEPFEIPAWERGIETAEIVSPFPQPLVITALGRSGATRADGIEAEIVQFADVDALRRAPEGSLKGKIVFITHRMQETMDGSSYGFFGAIRRAAPSIAASKGASAMLIRSLGTSNRRFAHTGSTVWGDGIDPIPAAALSHPDAEQLERVLKRGKPVTVRLMMTPKLLTPQMSGNVIGEITGREAPDEIVVIGGHLDSWDRGTGAVDDGAGVGISMAAAKLMIDAKLKPRRTVRVVLWGAEEPGIFGGIAYAKAHANDKTVVAAESDFGADKVWKFSHRVADSAKPLVARIAKVLEPLGVSYDASNTARGGPDLGPLYPLGVPNFTPQQNGMDYFNLHHTPDDTLDKIDPAKLNQNVAVYAAMTWMAANSDVVFGPLPATPATR